MACASPVEFDMRPLKIIVCGLIVVPCLALAELQVVVIEGLGGEARYTEQFAAQVISIEAAAGP
jgi:hypothetical protein